MYKSLTDNDFDDLSSLKSITTKEQFSEYILRVYSNNSSRDVLLSIVLSPEYNFLECFVLKSVLYFRMFDRKNNKLILQKIKFVEGNEMRTLIR